MKTLYLIRHAKSSWKNLELTDFERPLNSRGKRDAPFMGEILAKQGVQFDTLITSPAKRALRTGQKIAQKVNYEKVRIKRELALYHATGSEIITIISQQPEQINSLAVIGHNPGFTEAANQLGSLQIENVPTAGIVALSFNVSSWEELKPGAGQLLWFDYPKRYPMNQ